MEFTIEERIMFMRNQRYKSKKLQHWCWEKFQPYCHTIGYGKVLWITCTSKNRHTRTLLTMQKVLMC